LALKEYLARPFAEVECDCDPDIADSGIQNLVKRAAIHWQCYLADILYGEPPSLAGILRREFVTVRRNQPQGLPVGIAGCWPAHFK